MTNRMRHAAEGVIGGLTGTALMMEGMKNVHRLPQRIQPPAINQDPGEFLVNRVERITGKSLSTNYHGKLAHSAHWAYGMTWPFLASLLEPEAGFKTWRQAAIAGAGLGATVWAAGHVVMLPALGMMQPVHKQGVQHVTSALLTHISYGVACTVAMHAIERLWQRSRTSVA